jgi:hypothetical protein
MKRGWVYLVFGPTFGVLGAVLWAMIDSGVSAALRDPAEGAFLAFIFGFFVSWPSLFVDASLARVVPIAARAPLMAASGTVIAFAWLTVALPPLASLQYFIPIGIIAAGSVGACSILAGDFSKA